MGKIIWKKGKAGELALKTSASRMARDLLRVPNEKAKMAHESYFANKSNEPNDRIRLERMVNKAVVRRGKMLRNSWQEFMHLKNQCRQLREGMDRMERMYEFDNGPVALLKRFRNSAQTILNNSNAMVKKLKIYESFLSKEDAKKAGVERKVMEQRIRKLVAKIAQIEGKMAERELE